VTSTKYTAIYTAHYIRLVFIRGWLYRHKLPPYCLQEVYGCLGSGGGRYKLLREKNTKLMVYTIDYELGRCYRPLVRDTFKVEGNNDKAPVYILNC
jgi:hypothetical protein